MSEIKKVIESVINPPPRFEILNLYGNNVFSIQSIANDSECLLLTFYSDHIYVDNLEKCELNGVEVLQWVEKIGRRIPRIRYIKLTDGSQIELNSGIEIDLATLKILSKGQSWFNSQGYYSKDFDYENRYNKNIITSTTTSIFQEQVRDLHLEKIRHTFSKKVAQTNLQEYQSQISQKSISPDERRDLKASIDTQILIINDNDNLIDQKLNLFNKSYDDHLMKGEILFPQVSLDDTVQKYYNNILQSLQKDSNSMKEKWLVQSIHLIMTSNILKYDNQLFKVITRRGGTKRRKSRKSKSKKRKSKGNKRK